MPLAPGTWLGHYEILEHLGSGGMGDVYRARDNKLQREVALKLLPPAFARDPERIARLRREAQLLAQLNHPNIAAIYNFEEIGEARFLVMELVLGETLRERGKRGPLPVEETLAIGKQIAEAMEHAHEKPIIHRDLKPANVKITPQGQVKVLDFGLAKAFGGDAPKVDPHDAPTGSLAGTLQGTILGTPAYMSPEQASGKAVDRRADIWAFGCVLYELLTAKQAFSGDSVTEIIAGVLRGEPDWQALPETTPANIQVLLRRCLEKNPNQRFHHPADIRIQVEEALGIRKPAPPIPAKVPAHLIWRWAIISGLACLILGAIAGIAVWNFRSSPASPPVTRTVVPLPPQDRIRVDFWPSVAVSPDGTHLVYVASSGSGIQQLYLRAMDSSEAKPIAGTEGGSGPFFSPDGQWVGFFAPGKLKKVPITGGASLTLCDAALSRGAAWGPNDNIIFNPTNTSSGLSVVPAAGGKPEAFTKPDFSKGEVSHRWPAFLPGGKAVVFTVVSGGNADDAKIVARNLETGERRVLIQGGSYPRYAPTGHIVYYRDGTVMAVPFDLKRLEVTGSPFPIVEGVMGNSGNTGAAQYALSDLGSLVYVVGAGSQDIKRSLVWVDRKGMVQPLRAPPRGYQNPRLSPDGQRVAIEVLGANADIWVYELARETLTRLTFDPNADETPAWAPDGKNLAFAHVAAGGMNILRRLADGSGTEESLLTIPGHAHVGSWSPDAQMLALEEQRAGTGSDIWILPLEGDKKPKLFLQTPFSEQTPAFSPDGRWLAYRSDESGRSQVYVQPYPGPGGKWQISTEGGTELVWARNGRELFYRSGDKMMAVEITTQPAFAAGTPKVLFEGQYESAAGRTNYDVSLDGQRFLMVKASEQQPTPTQINVVLNWFEELKRRVPTK